MTVARAISGSLTLLFALATGCDTRLFGTEERALIDLSPGPQQGAVGQGPTTPDPTSPSPSTSAAALDAALARLDDVRARLDLAPARRHEALAAAAQAHAAYTVEHADHHAELGLSPHAELPELSGFTGESPGARVVAAAYQGVLIGEVIGYQPTPVGTMEAWLESLYHRLPLLRPEAVEVGIGAAASQTLVAHVVEVGSDDATFAAAGATSSSAFVAWPHDGATDVPTSWSGLEVPQPAPPPQGYPSGPVLTLSAEAGELSITTAAVRPLGGAELPATLLTRASDAHLQPRDLALIPHLPLAPGTRYELAVTGTLDGHPFAWTSTFTTRPSGCRLDADDCGPGRACYALDGALTCLWEGVGAEGATCRYLDDCAAGLTCLGSRCRPLCADSAAPLCATRCPGQATLATGAPGVSACLGPACTPSTCGDGQGCYWLASLTCGWAGELSLGATCTYANDCSAGLSCLGPTGSAHRCHALCDGPGMPACATVCTATPLTLDATIGLKACL